MLRISGREATIKQLKFPKDTLDKLEKLASSNVTEDVKKLGIKKLTGGVSPCCVCGDIPTYEILYKYEDATRVERYCDKCVKSVYAREAVL
jgi:hypothetical protein